MTSAGALASVVGTTPLGTESLDALRARPVAEVAKEFEAMLLAQMIGAMRKTVGESGLLSASPERKMLDGFFDLELARSLVDEVDLGLARQLAGEVERRDGADPASDAHGDEAITRPQAVLTDDAWLARTQTYGSVAADVAAQRAHGARAYGGVLTPPVVAPVSSAYGARLDPLDGAPDFHAGLDLAAPRGTPVRAAADGTVTFSGARGAAGNLVELRHRDGTRTSYAHLDGIRVAEGDVVLAGQVLGAVGSTGRTTGPHLHFAVERDGVALDPAPLLKKGRG